MRKLLGLLTGLVVLMLSASIALANDQNRPAREFSATLSGDQERPVPNASPAVGAAQFEINRNETAIAYELEYEGIVGGEAFAAHIHLGSRDVAGPVVAFLCGGGGKPACPKIAGSISGVITAADLVGPLAGQPLSALAKELRNDNAYANVHSVPQFPGGEIRGHIVSEDEGDD
jgi:hypothetical protein